MSLEAIDKRRVAQAYRVAEHGIEVADRLVEVEREQQAHAHDRGPSGSRANEGTRVTISLSGASPDRVRSRIRRPTVVPGSRPTDSHDTAISKILRAAAGTGSVRGAGCCTPFGASRATSFRSPLSSRSRRRRWAPSPGRNDSSRPSPAKAAGPVRTSGSILRQNAPSREKP